MCSPELVYNMLLALIGSAKTVVDAVEGIGEVDVAVVWLVSNADEESFGEANGDVETPDEGETEALWRWRLCSLVVSANW